MIELDDYVSIRFLYRIHLQRYVLWCNSFICQNYIEIKKNAKNHLLLEIISRSVLAFYHERTLLNLSLNQIFIPLVLRGHDCNIVLFITLTQVIGEWHVFGRFINGILAVMTCGESYYNVTSPPHPPWLIQLFTLHIPWCLLFQIPTSILFKTLFSLLSL